MERTIVAYFMSRAEAGKAVDDLRRQELISEAHLMENMDVAAQLSNRLWDSQLTVGDVSDETGGINLVVRATAKSADKAAAALLDLGARRAEIY